MAEGKIPILKLKLNGGLAKIIVKEEAKNEKPRMKNCKVIFEKIKITPAIYAEYVRTYQKRQEVAPKKDPEPIKKPKVSNLLVK